MKLLVGRIDLDNHAVYQELHPSVLTLRRTPPTSPSTRSAMARWARCAPFRAVSIQVPLGGHRVAQTSRSANEAVRELIVTPSVAPRDCPLPGVSEPTGRS